MNLLVVAFTKAHSKNSLTRLYCDTYLNLLVVTLASESLWMCVPLDWRRGTLPSKVFL